MKHESDAQAAKRSMVVLPNTNVDYQIMFDIVVAFASNERLSIDVVTCPR